MALSADRKSLVHRAMLLETAIISYNILEGVLAVILLVACRWLVALRRASLDYRRSNIAQHIGHVARARFGLLWSRTTSLRCKAVYDLATADFETSVEEEACPSNHWHEEHFDTSSGTA